MTQSSKKAFTFMDYSKLMTLPDPEWLIPDLIPKNGLVMLYAPANTGKSFIALSMLCSVATGLNFLPNVKTKRGTALYCFGEGGAGIKPRVQGWFKKNRKRGKDANLVFYPDAVNLFDSREVEDFIAAVKSQMVNWGYPLTIIGLDTLATCTAGVDENSNAEMGVVMQNCDRIRKALGVTVLLVHHSGKSGSYRGASVTMCNVDTTSKLEPKSKESVVLQVEKQKDAERISDLEMRLTKIDLPKNQTTLVAECVGYFKGGSAANDNHEGSSVQQAKSCLLEIIDAYGEGGVSWTDLRAEAKARGHGLERGSDLTDAKKKMLKEGLIREAQGKLVSLDAVA